MQEQNQVAGHIENMKIQFYMHQNIITNHCCNHKGKAVMGWLQCYQSLTWSHILVKQKINSSLKIIFTISLSINIPLMEIIVVWIQKGIPGHWKLAPRVSLLDLVLRRSGNLPPEHLLHAKSTLNYNHLPARKALEKERVAQCLTRAHSRCAWNSRRDQPFKRVEMIQPKKAFWVIQVDGQPWRGHLIKVRGSIIGLSRTNVFYRSLTSSKY